MSKNEAFPEGFEVRPDPWELLVAVLDPLKEDGVSLIPWHIANAIVEGCQVLQDIFTNMILLTVDKERHDNVSVFTRSPGFDLWIDCTDILRQPTVKAA